MKITYNINLDPKLLPLINVNCFKLLCMISPSKRSEIVRKYFVLIENAYRLFMLQEISDRRRIDRFDYDEKNYQPVNYPIGPCIYVLKIVDGKNLI